MRKIFITGAAGFIGFHAAQKLHQNGTEVGGFDNFNTYYDVSLKEKRAGILRELGISTFRGDICDTKTLENAIKAFQPTHILHLAAQAGVRYSLDHPQAYIASNLEGFLNILEVCRSLPSVKLVYASSSSVYGLNTKVPFSIEDRTDHQASLYGVTKKSNELMARSYRHLFGIKAIGLRYFTVYGPWGRPDMAYYSFTRNILDGTPIPVFNNGQMRRDFTYIDDIVQGTLAALDYEGEVDTFNLGNHSPVELGTMIDILEKLLGQKAVRNYLPMQSGDVVETFADIEASSRHLGYHPTTDLEKGLSRFVDWYRSQT